MILLLIITPPPPGTLLPLITFNLYFFYIPEFLLSALCLYRHSMKNHKGGTSMANSVHWLPGSSREGQLQWGQTPTGTDLGLTCG
jgi:hypothetical protein